MKTFNHICLRCASLGICCLVECKSCKRGKSHDCKNCGKKGARHRSVTCNAKITREECTVGNPIGTSCGHCKVGERHDCRNCGSKNHHRTKDCIYEEVTSCMKCIGALPIRSSGPILAVPVGTLGVHGLLFIPGRR